MSFQLSAIDDDELIHRAACQGHCISLEVYLNQNPNCINKFFTYAESTWTPLLAACFYKHEHVVRMLLTRFKPDINAIGTINLKTLENRLELVEEVSSLWTAAAVNHFDIVKLLIEHGNANINQLIKTHSTALRAACYHNNIEMVEYLIKHGANPHQARIGNYTNLMLCAGRQYPLLVKYLVSEIQCDINEKDENGQTALYYAVRSGSIEITKFLLEHGALKNYTINASCSFWRN
jgi:ankyrin repeat protein